MFLLMFSCFSFVLDTITYIDSLFNVVRATAVDIRISSYRLLLSCVSR